MLKPGLKRVMFKFVIFVLGSCWLPGVNAEEQSVPMRLAIQGCEQSPTHREQLACMLMMHDMMCFSSVIKGAVDFNDDRRQCMTESENVTIKKYFSDAMEENKNDPTRKALLQEVYKQWQYKISTLASQPLEPEYQFKLRRDTNSQALLFKLLVIQAEID